MVQKSLCTFIILCIAYKARSQNSCADALGTSSNAYLGDDGLCHCKAGTYDISADNYRRFTYRSFIASGHATPNGKLWFDESQNMDNPSDTSGLAASSDGFQVTTKCTSGNGARAEICYLQGGIRSTSDYDYVDFFAGSLPSTAATVCSVSRYSSTVAAHQNRILTSADVRWYHGHDSGIAGTATYYETPRTSTQTSNPPVATNWLVMCGETAAPFTMLANGVDVTITPLPTVTSRPPAGNLAINKGWNGPASFSDWAIMELIVWNRALSTADLQSVSSFYTNILSGSIPQTQSLMCVPCAIGYFCPGGNTPTNMNATLCLAGYF